MTRTIIRGDSYAIRRPFYIHTFVDGNGLAVDMSGWTIRTTYKPTTMPAATDPLDASAAITHYIAIDGTGAVINQDGLYLDTTAAAGILNERLTAAETLALALDTSLFNDVEVTDENGEVFSFVYTEDLIAVDAYTNRTSDV